MKLDIFEKGFDDDKISTYDSMDRLNRRRGGFLSTACVLISGFSRE